MIKLHLGCGGNILENWINTDVSTIDIRNTLPYDNNSVDCIFLEHVLEHVDSSEAFRFIDDAYRVLKVGGKIRIAVPSVVSIFNKYTDDYNKFVTLFTHKDASLKNSIEAIICLHGHKTIWDETILETILKCIGFKTNVTKHFSEDECFKECISHKFNPNYIIETIAVEGTK